MIRPIRAKSQLSWTNESEPVPVSQDTRLFSVLLAALLLAPFLRLCLLLAFSWCWLREKYRQEAIFHFLYKQLKTIEGLLSSWDLAMITVMYLTRVLPAPW